MHASRPKISLLICDLDNTLWPWFDMWYAGFVPLIDGLQTLLNIDRQQLLTEIQSVHRQKGTSEYHFLIQELPCVRRQFARLDPLPDQIRDIVETSQRERKAASRLYENVIETLEVVRQSGCRVVGFTESKAFSTAQRLRTLGLDGVIDVVYSPEDHAAPPGIDLRSVRQFDDAHYRLKITRQRFTPPGVVKPAPSVLRSILEDMMVSASSAAYVGDDLVKDVSMAVQSSVLSVHAKYGEIHGDLRYDLLRRVTHWTQSAVNIQASTTQAQIRPDYTIEKFSELLGLFDFEWPSQRTSISSSTLEAWKVTVSTQQHFNDVQVKLRSALVTVVTAVAAAVGFTLKQPSVVHIFNFNIRIGTLISVAGLIAVLAFGLLDWGYHKLLVGSVQHGMAIEKRCQATSNDLSLATAISTSSPIKIGFLVLSSNQRLLLFYAALLSVFVVAIVVAQFFVKEVTTERQDVFAGLQF